MNIERVELLRSYRFGERAMAAADVSRFIVGQRGIESIELVEGGLWVRIETADDVLLIPAAHIDYAKPAKPDAATAAARSEAGRKGAAKRWGKTDPPEVA